MTPIRFENISQLREAILDSPLQHYVAVLLSDMPVDFTPGAIERIEQIGADTESPLLYGYYRERLADGSLIRQPVAPYQIGSVTDSFNFGPVVFLNAAITLHVISVLLNHLGNDPLPLDGGWYSLRLRLSTIAGFIHIPEYLYTVDKSDFRKSGERQFDYLKASAEVMQRQHEGTFRLYLELIGARLLEKPERVNVDEGLFPVEASVIIPVRNRVRTIGDAVRSALSQQTDFEFNVIVVDNCSDDGTSEVLASIADSRLHVISPQPDEQLGIGGCWNRAIDSEWCGRFAVQLDSDDIYSGPDTLTHIVEKFHTDRCGMVVGSYRLTDLTLNPIGEGIIDHKEWTDRNGRNNALRVNGFGAPRAFYTPIARMCRFPDVSYGEDYAMCLRVSREFYVGRIYEPIYLCRRWEGNSDADLSPEAVVAHQIYKDYLRSVEIQARIKLNTVDSPSVMSMLGSDLNFFDDELDLGDENFDSDDNDWIDEDDLPF